MWSKIPETIDRRALPQGKMLLYCVQLPARHTTLTLSFLPNNGRRERIQRTTVKMSRRSDAPPAPLVPSDGKSPRQTRAQKRSAAAPPSASLSVSGSLRAGRSDVATITKESRRVNPGAGILAGNSGSRSPLLRKEPTLIGISTADGIPRHAGGKGCSRAQCCEGRKPDGQTESETNVSEVPEARKQRVDPQRAHYYM